MTQNLDSDLLLDMDFVPKEEKRPVFLTVLCILSFVGTGLSFFWNLYLLWVMRMMEAAMNVIDELKTASFKNQEFADFFVYYKYGYVIITSNICGALLILTGALVMWKLKRIGFVIYILGQVFPIVLYYSLVGTGVKELEAFIHIAEFFSLAFIIMYALNVKHMTK